MYKIIFLACILGSCQWAEQHPAEVKLAEDVAEEVIEVIAKDVAKAP